MALCIVEVDIKKLIAFSTCSQIGYMFINNGFNSAHWFRWTTDLVLEYKWVCKI